MEDHQPLVPAEVDLRDFPYMPIDIVRLFGSDFHAQSDDTAWRAGVTLWLKSYHQVPAASVPDDDVALARLAEFGRDVKGWKKIRAAAMRGWRKCKDGRFYHPVVAEKVLEAWVEKLNQRKSSAAGNAKRYGQTFDASGIEAAVQDCLKRLATLNPNSRLLLKRLPKPSPTPPDDLPSGAKPPPVGSKNPPTGTSVGSPDAPPDELPSGSQEKGREEKGREEEDSAAQLSTAAARSKRFEVDPNDLDPLFREVGDACRAACGLPHPADAGIGKIVLMVQGGIPLKTITTVMRSERDRPRQRPILTWDLWAKIVADKLREQPKLVAVAGEDPTDPRIDLGGGFSALLSQVRQAHSTGSWPNHWGPRIGESGCRIRARDLPMIVGAESGRAA